MQTVPFPESNITFAKDQPQYQPLPAHMANTDLGPQATFCWQLTPEEIQELIANGGRIWHQVLTFGKPLQPVRLTVTKPELAHWIPGNRIEDVRHAVTMGLREAGAVTVYFATVDRDPLVAQGILEQLADNFGWTLEIDPIALKGTFSRA